MLAIMVLDSAGTSGPPGLAYNNNAVSPTPEVELINYFSMPYDNSVATARTCYSSKVVYPEDVSATEKARSIRDKIAESIYKAGHHTTIQHPTFQFVFKKVSRQFIWSFLHSHPFYNSEQVSQRYVKVKRGTWTVPALPNDAAAKVFDDSCRALTQDYERLVKVLIPHAGENFFRVFTARKRDDKRWKNAIKKKAYENARYVLPVATHAHLYHTISGLTLHRYHRLVQIFDTPTEQKVVVEAMLDRVRAVDPMFFKNVEDAVPLEETLEHELFERFHGATATGQKVTKAFLKEFDEDLGPLTSKLIDWKANGEESLARAVRTVLGVSRADLGDDEAIAAALDPLKNPGLTGFLNVSAHHKLTRSLCHPHFTFRKVLSHSADSQDQRHRMVPGSRPILAAHVVPGQPDVIAPRLIAENADAREIFEEASERAYDGIKKLRELGASAEASLYLLPNSAKIRFEESGDLLNLRHKWSLRLCYLAQEEIFKATQDEVLQIRQVAPRIASLIGPPCWSRHRTGLKPYCPEGERFCGVRVWELDISEYDRY
jgi:thymidylate synthase ThyX